LCEIATKHNKKRLLLVSTDAVIKKLLVTQSTLIYNLITHDT